MWRAIIASTRSSPPTVIATQSFGTDQASRLDGWLQGHRPAAVLCVIPAAAVICRNCTLPDAAPEQLTQALQLQAEAHLLSIAPPHRLGMAVLPGIPGETTRTGLVFAWPEAAVFPMPPTNYALEFVPDVAALAALLNGERPLDLPLWLDREDGSVALAISHTGGLAFRATREEPEASDDWPRSIGRIAAETALGVGHSGAFIENLVDETQSRAATVKPGSSRLFLPQETMIAAGHRVQGERGESSWWSEFGIAVGALLARTGHFAAVTHMKAAPEVERPTLVGSIAQSLSRPRTAVYAVLACLALLMFGPLVFSGIRLVILNFRFSDVQTQLVAATAARQQVAVYEELERQKVWSMTKLLADITGYTPLGIELESIRIEGGNIAIGGTAIATGNLTPAQLVAQMQENLRRHGMFSEIGVTAGKSDNLGRFRFDLSAKVTRPYSKPELNEDLDFAVKTHAERLYGPAARPGGVATTTASASSTQSTAAAGPQTPRATSAPSVPDDALASAITEVDVPLEYESNEARRSSGTRFGGPGVANPADDLGSGSTGVDPRPVPPPLDVELVNVMSVAELKDALSKIGKARQSRELDKETMDRLKSEWDMVMKRLREAPSS